MRFPDMDIPWVFPVQHERKLYAGKILEIHYSRILLAFLLTIVFFLIVYPILELGTNLVTFTGYVLFSHY